MNTFIDSTGMAYTDEGEGFTLAFIHGFPLCRQAWSRQVEAFHSKYRVIAPDLPGFGTSRPPSGPVAIAGYARGVHDLLQHVNPGPVVLVGHSMGGYVALEFARAFPEALRGLVLVGTKSGADSPATIAARHASAERVRQAGPSQFAATLAAGMLFAGDPDEAAAASVRGMAASASPEGIIGALQAMAGRPDAAAWLDSIHVPTLVIAGEEDRIIPPAESEALARSIPGAKLKLIPGAGHLVAFEKPSAFNEALKAWLAWGDASRPLLDGLRSGRSATAGGISR